MYFCIMKLDFAQSIFVFGHQKNGLFYSKSDLKYLKCILDVFLTNLNFALPDVFSNEFISNVFWMYF